MHTLTLTPEDEFDASLRNHIDNIQSTSHYALDAGASSVNTELCDAIANDIGALLWTESRAKWETGMILARAFYEAADAKMAAILPATVEETAQCEQTLEQLAAAVRMIDNVIVDRTAQMSHSLHAENDGNDENIFRQICNTYVPGLKESFNRLENSSLKKTAEIENIRKIPPFQRAL